MSPLLTHISPIPQPELFTTALKTLAFSVVMTRPYAVGWDFSCSPDLVPHCQYPQMLSHSELFHFNPSFLAVSCQKMPNILIDRSSSVSTLSSFQADPLFLANVPSFTLKQLCFAAWISFPFKGRVLLHTCCWHPSNQHPSPAHPDRS